MPEPAPAPSLHGLAACLAVLEGEALALRHPLAAHLIGAAAAALRAEVSAPEGAHQQGLLGHAQGPGPEAG